jgi:hypothetical protein
MLRVILGIVIGAAVAFGAHYGACWLLNVGRPALLIICGIATVVGGAYTGTAMGLKIYDFGFLSIVGLLLDLTWSMLNTLAGFIVWLPACLIIKAKRLPSTNARRSGTFVFDDNPRGDDYPATTIGTVIGGEWNSHEELHVWQGRLFGPTYLAIYGLSLLLNMAFGLLAGRTKGAGHSAYLRVCWEDWAYWSGSLSGGTIKWGAWFGGLLLCSLYSALVLLIPVGLAVNLTFLWTVGAGGLVGYSLIRTFTPTSNK